MEIYGTGPKLATSADWVPWSYHFYLLARHFEVYQYVDPKKTTKHAKEPEMLYYRDLLTFSTETSAGNAAAVVSAPTAAEVVAAAAVTTTMINIATCKIKDRETQRVEWKNVDDRIQELIKWTIVTVDNRLLRVVGWMDEITELRELLTALKAELLITDVYLAKAAAAQHQEALKARRSTPGTRSRRRM